MEVVLTAVKVVMYGGMIFGVLRSNRRRLRKEESPPEGRLPGGTERGSGGPIRLSRGRTDHRGGQVHDLGSWLILDPASPQLRDSTPTGGGAFLPFATSHHQWHEYGLIKDEQHQQHESRHHSTSEQEGDAGRHE
jgi:hypothetical protein